MDGNENAHSTLIALSPEDLHDLLEKAAEVGANAGIDKYVEELKKSQKKRGDRRLHNTKLLLRNFRMLQENAENSVFGRTQMEESAADILESMMNIYNDVLVVESIKNSATRTGIIVSHVRTMLEIFEVCCEKSSNEPIFRFASQSDRSTLFRHISVMEPVCLRGAYLSSPHRRFTKTNKS